MAVIAPFRGLHYNSEKIQRLEDVVTPPYDVINEQAHAAFLQKNSYNMIQLDLSKSLKSETLTPARYLQAKQTFERWQQEHILIRDTAPALYIYDVDYAIPSGQRYTRKGMVALVQLSDFSQGIVKPHEKTFAAVTADRLQLIETCEAQFSMIFSLYSDPAAEIMTCLHGAAGKSNGMMETVDQDGCRHTIQTIDNPDILRRVTEMFKDKAIYIADGHHRYTTSLQYRDRLRARLGELPPAHPANYVMMYLCPMEDPGLSILPTHRLVRLPEHKDEATVEGIIAKLGSCFQVEEITGGSRETLLAEVLNRMDENSQQASPDARPTMFGFYHAHADRCFLLVQKKEMMEKVYGDRHPAAMRELDVVVLSDLVLGHCLGLGLDDCVSRDLIAYYSDPDEAMDAAVKEAAAEESKAPVLFLMNKMPVSQVKRVADESLIMPHKSTYFYPKMLTGLLLNKLDLPVGE